jgi:hypothetical protein
MLLSFDNTAKQTGTIIEFDTEEMAAAWRRDISGSLNCTWMFKMN